jgi:4-aminobutyrate aminotransferase-like enzyme
MMKSAHGNVIVDKFNLKWLDMLSGILNVSLGHGSKVVDDALNDVIMSGLINTYDRPAENARLLCELLHHYDSRFEWLLVNTGAEAVERAIQITATAIKRLPKVAVLQNSFHGKSISMSCARYDVPWGNPIELITIDPNANHVPSFDMLFYEPIQGWSGHMPDERRLREMCDIYGATLVADEMITSFMRCGVRFMNRSADMVIAGKGIAQGAPLALLGGHYKAIRTVPPTGLNTTCGGNNLTSTIGLRVLSHLIQEEIELGFRVNYIQRRLQDLGFYGLGAFGFKLVDGNYDKFRKVFEHYRLVISWHKPYIRVGPSFVTTSEELDRFTQVLQIAENVACQSSVSTSMEHSPDLLNGIVEKQ